MVAPVSAHHCTSALSMHCLDYVPACQTLSIDYIAEVHAEQVLTRTRFEGLQAL